MASIEFSSVSHDLFRADDPARDLFMILRRAIYSDGRIFVCMYRPPLGHLYEVTLVHGIRDLGRIGRKANGRVRLRLSNVPLLTVSGELTRFRIRDAAQDNRATLQAGFLWTPKPIPIRQRRISTILPDLNNSFLLLSFTSRVAFRSLQLDIMIFDR